ncbi:Encodes alpha-helical IF-like protein isoform 2 [Hibiscus syriacus]|uniref:Encodes alpha-helical IF-like protein isoform 2 n=2 Tax=Hibiscus syriacus TaxID=106335 RepID=A0A6A3ARK1_HIBSY|nr:Encodes alpha-helical IF-like protein isoform 2 [Hibiscus syriacus]
MEEEIFKLQKSLEERNGELQASASAAEKYLRELDDLRSQLTQATADASAALAQSAQVQCLALLKELDQKNSSLKEHEARVTWLGKQLDNLQKDLQARDCSQKQLKDEVLRIEHDIMQAVAKAGANKDSELRKLLNEVSPKSFEKISKQLEKQRRADQELKKRVLKLEFCLQEARSQTRKLQRMGERRDKALKELRDQLAAKQQSASVGNEKQNFWETSGFKIIVSMSMLILVVFLKR